MKKVIMIIAACGLVVACQQKGKNAENANGATDSTTVANDTLVYQGEGPAADGTYKYMLSIYGDSIKECAYEQKAITPKAVGEEIISKTTGLPAFIEKEGKKYIRVQANKEDSVTFLQLNDSTLRLVSKDFKEAGKDTNTDLKLKK